MNETHSIPRWLRVMNDLLFAWWAFWLTALVVGGTCALVAAVLKVQIDGFIPVISTIVVCLFVGIAGAIVTTRWWDRLMQSRTIKANYIAFAVLVLISVALGPGPMTFIE